MNVAGDGARAEALGSWLVAAIIVLVQVTPGFAQTATAPPDHHDAKAAQPPPDADANPVLQLRAFGDVQFRATDTGSAKTTFALGQLDLFITSALGDSFSVLAETVVEANDENKFGFEIERLQLQYFPNDHVKLIVGRYHANIGYYNTAYHHGTWFQTTVGRPRLFSFEDQGGILPIHDVGISATGLISSGALGLHYVAEVGNGRDWRLNAEAVQNAIDNNTGKAVNVGFFARPAAWSGFQAGATVYRSRITNGVEPEVTHTILAAHVVYERPDLEVLNEFVLQQHQPDGGGTFRTPAFYSQLSRRFGRVRPFVRYEFIDIEPGTPILAATGREHGPSLGVRYEAGSFVALKAQYDRLSRQARDASNGVTVQMAFTF